MLASWLVDPWIWLGLALALLLAELVVSGYVLLSFSVGAAIMTLGLGAWRLLAAPDAGAPMGTLGLLIAWMVASAVALALIWRFWRGRSHGAGPDEDVNEFKNRL
ncbi:hypothetical protein P2H44_08085 [Albimonas sp. CAU 1670]|uniref:hypothetical protein n=1 Tax=Albimonas sp. CAU 1670 TaxID=3032599 RepID=UPI0023DC2D36|nr:hypothetical protein [Albimonas sp. CAU 1670]MDF2232508.1 hypothetical protein [Albimonas sp. CAU 1670]